MRLGTRGSDVDAFTVPPRGRRKRRAAPSPQTTYCQRIIRCQIRVCRPSGRPTGWAPSRAFQFLANILEEIGLRLGWILADHTDLRQTECGKTMGRIEALAVHPPDELAALRALLVVALMRVTSAGGSSRDHSSCESDGPARFRHRLSFPALCAWRRASVSASALKSSGRRDGVARLGCRDAGGAIMSGEACFSLRSVVGIEAAEGTGSWGGVLQRKPHQRQWRTRRANAQFESVPVAKMSNPARTCRPTTATNTATRHLSD